MKKFVIEAVGVATLLGTALGLAGTAAAAPAVPADSVVNGLQSEGYTVQINKTPTSPLSACSVGNVQALSPAGTPGAVALVDVVCPDGC